MRTSNHLLEIERVDTQILKGKNIFVVIVFLNEIKDENHFLFNFPLNLALRNELFVKIEQTWPELKHLNNFNIIAIMASERLVQIIVHFAKKSWSLMIVDLTSV
jgi:hypothetical protein